MRSMLPAQHPRNTSRSCLSSVQVVGAIRHKRTSRQMDGEYKQLLGKLLRLHPDYYSMWNFRKEAVLAEVSAKRARLQDKRRRQREAKRHREPAKLFSRQCSASRALPFFSLSLSQRMRTRPCYCSDCPCSLQACKSNPLFCSPFCCSLSFPAPRRRR